MKYDTQHIDKYLDGELSEPEVNTFEAEMQKDGDFAYEVKLQQTARETVEYANFMDKIEKVRSEKPPSEQPEKSSNGIIRRLLPIVGLAAAALIALLIWPFWHSSPVDKEQQWTALAEDNYQTYALDITRKGEGEQSLTQAEKAYNSGDYETALPIFEKYPDNVEVQLAKGNAEYNLGKLDAATATFERIISADKYPYHEPTANWYLALSYLQQDQPEKAKTALKTINSGEYYDKARRLLKEIK